MASPRKVTVPVQLSPAPKVIWIEEYALNLDQIVALSNTHDHKTMVHTTGRRDFVIDLPLTDAVSILNGDAA